MPRIKISFRKADIYYTSDDGRSLSSNLKLLPHRRCLFDEVVRPHILT